MKLERLVIHWIFYLQGQIQEGSNHSINERWNRQRGKIGKVELNKLFKNKETGAERIETEGEK